MRRNDFKEVTIDAAYVIADIIEQGLSRFREALRTIVKRLRRALSQAPSVDIVVDQDAEDAMARALAEIGQQPRNMAHDGRAYETVVNEFIAEHHGTAGVDITGVYGPQSPDLVTAYIRQFQPGWMFMGGAAAKLWNQDVMPAGFIAIPASRHFWPERGDILVTWMSDQEPFGNVAIVSGREAGGVRVLTQTPDGCQFHLYSLGDPVGYYRWVGVA